MAPSKPAFLSSLLTGLDKSSSYNYILDFILGLPVSFPALIIPVNINQLIYQYGISSHSAGGGGILAFGPGLGRVIAARV